MTFHSNRKTEIVYKMDDPEYRADKALSTSELKKMRESPKAFWSYRNKIYPYTSTPAMEKGTLFHMYALEPGRFANEVITCPEEYTNKRKKVSQDWWKEQEAQGKKVIKETDLQVHYTKILQRAGVEVKRWIFAVIETEPPYESSEIILAEADLVEARKEVDGAYKKLLSCMRVDSWPSHTPTKPVEISRFNTADRAA